MNRPDKSLVGCIMIAVALVAEHGVASNPPKTEARVTKIIRDVKLLPSDAPPRSAADDDKVSENTAVRTGDESRSELTFEDLTITRLGANTIFSFNKAGRSGQLGGGSILVHVPKDSGGGEFRTKAVTVGIAGTTLIFEFMRSGRSKLSVLEGGARVALVKHPRKFADVRAGQMLDVKAGATKLPAPVDIDLDRIMKTHPLITDFPPLPSQDLIFAAIQEQHAKASGVSPVSQGKPGISSTPTSLTPQGAPTFVPLPKATPTPKVITLPTKPRPTPRATAAPKPTATPKESPRPSPRATQPPKGSRPPPRPIKPTKKATPIPSPSPRIL